MNNQQENDYGIVYVLTNEAMPGLVKIGMTLRKDVKIRMSELYGTGVPIPFDCKYACRVPAEDCAKVEKALHTAFQPQRINGNREFFKIEPRQAIAILELLNNEEVTTEVNDDMSTNLTQEDRSAAENMKASRRPPFDFYEMGLRNGDILELINDPNITVTVDSNKKVLYQGQQTSLSDVTRQLLNIPPTQAPQPTRRWMYNGERLSDIYDRTYPVEE